MSAEIVGFSILLIGILLLIGKWIRVSFSIFQKYFLPSSIIAGFIGLLLGPGGFNVGEEYLGGSRNLATGGIRTSA